MASLVEYLIGIIFILFLAIFAFKRDALTEGGTLTAISIGLLTFLFPAAPISGRIWFALLGIFFLSSFFITKFKAAKKEEVNKQFAKGSTRDSMQVFANGAGAAVLAVVYHLYPLNAVFAAFAAILATVNADTWATELGVLSRDKPFLITNFKRVEKGVSGAVSRFGLFAAFLGAISIAFSAIVLITLDSRFFGSKLLIPGGVPIFIAIVAVLGTVGSLLDSLLGATLQIMYYCKKCKKETERTVHVCGTKTTYYKGVKFFDNDVVNLSSSLLAGFLAFVLYIALAGFN